MPKCRVMKAHVLWLPVMRNQKRKASSKVPEYRAIRI